MWFLAFGLMVLWAVGVITAYTLGGWIYILLVAGIITLIVNLFRGRRTV